MGKVFKKLRCRYQKIVRGARIKGKSTAPPGKIFATGFLAPERRNFDKSPTFGRSGSRAQNLDRRKNSEPRPRVLGGEARPWVSLPAPGKFVLESCGGWKTLKLRYIEHLN